MARLSASEERDGRRTAAILSGPSTIALDATHVRFFTRESLYRCFEDAGLVVSHLERVRVEPEETEFRT
ncbi:MAG: hypothetical protein ACRDO9_09740, partial [Gaiellales bacterium]